MAQNHSSGADLKDARELAGLTQEQVAEKLGVARQTIVTWESKARVVGPKAEKYLRVVRELASQAA